MKITKTSIDVNGNITFYKRPLSRYEAGLPNRPHNPYHIPKFEHQGRSQKKVSYLQAMVEDFTSAIDPVQKALDWHLISHAANLSDKKEIITKLLENMMTQRKEHYPCLQEIDQEIFDHVDTALSVFAKKHFSIR